MSIGYVLISFGLGICIFLNVILVLDYKIKPQYMLPIFLLWYEVIGYSSQLGNKGIATIFEILLFCTTCGLFLKGNFWRNYFILIMEGFVVGIVFNICCLLIPILNDLFLMEEQSQRLSFVQGMGLAFATITSGWIVSFAFGKIVKKRYYGKAYLYKVLTLSYTAFAIAQMELKQLYNKQKLSQLSIDEFLYVLLSVGMSIVITICLVWIYDILEKKRIKKEQTALRQYVKNAYMNLKKDELENQPKVFYGNIIADSVIKGYIDFFDKKQIINEIYIQPCKQFEVINYEAVALVDNLLSLGTLVYDEAINNFFVKLIVRNFQGSLLIKVEFSEGKLLFRGNHFHRNKQIKKHLQLIQDILSMLKGFSHIDEYGNECEITIIIPLQREEIKE